MTGGSETEQLHHSKEWQEESQEQIQEQAAHSRSPQLGLTAPGGPGLHKQVGGEEEEEGFENLKGVLQETNQGVSEVKPKVDQVDAKIESQEKSVESNFDPFDTEEEIVDFEQGQGIGLSRERLDENTSIDNQPTGLEGELQIQGGQDNHPTGQPGPGDQTLLLTDHQLLEDVAAKEVGEDVEVEVIKEQFFDMKGETEKVVELERDHPHKGHVHHNPNHPQHGGAHNPDHLQQGGAPDHVHHINPKHHDQGGGHDHDHLSDTVDDLAGAEVAPPAVQVVENKEELWQGAGKQGVVENKEEEISSTRELDTGEAEQDKNSSLISGSESRSPPGNYAENSGEESGEGATYPSYPFNLYGEPDDKGGDDEVVVEDGAAESVGETISEEGSNVGDVVKKPGGSEVTEWEWGNDAKELPKEMATEIRPPFKDQGKQRPNVKVEKEKKGEEVVEEEEVEDPLVTLMEVEEHSMQLLLTPKSWQPKASVRLSFNPTWLPNIRNLKLTTTQQ